MRGFIEAGRRLRPDAGFECKDVAGGVATFMGAASPLSQATSIALETPVSAKDIARITDFYRDRGAPPRISVNPLADASLENELVRAGYAPLTRNNVLAIDASTASTTMDERVTEELDLDAWGRASYAGFSDRYSNGDEGVFLATTIASSDGVVALAIRNGDGIVATSALLMQEDLASLIAGSTLIGHRGKGYHRAMILDRLSRAR
ncbi:MAG TPA: hypothetical protein VKB39_00850, partial [Candidatus Baltobacteraceae bacterium]|nr:hypothetical protein [Candidatus Baltobacteraceae bacterium]